MALRWTSALAVGVRGIDEQHEELFRRYEALEDAILRRDRSEATRLLVFLKTYVREHFQSEEALMRLVAYPDTSRHHDEHEAFAAQIERLDLARALFGNTAELVVKLERDVGGWLRDHIYGSDVALARFVQERRYTPRMTSAEAEDAPAA